MKRSNRERFIEAHKLAKQYRSFFESYRAAFSWALTDLYAEERRERSMAEKTTAAKLEDLGINAWECGEMKRYYLDDSSLEAVFGLSIGRYNTGNISSARLNGEKISNSRAYKLIGQKIFYDAINDAWMQKRDGRTVALCAELAYSIRI